MRSMTVQEVRRNLQCTEDFIDDIQFKKEKIHEQIFELEVLQRKIAQFHEEFEHMLRQRKEKINLHIGETNRNQSLSRYISGMQELLDGVEGQNVHEGLWESGEQIKKRICALEREIDECERQLLYQKDRRDYWWIQLSMAMAKEG